MAFPIYEPIKSVKVYVRYYHGDALTGTVKQVDDCFASTIEQFKNVLLRSPGLAGSVGYGKNIRPDLKAIIRLEWNDKIGFTSVEFSDAKSFIEFVKERKSLAEAMEYKI